MSVDHQHLVAQLCQPRHVAMSLITRPDVTTNAGILCMPCIFCLLSATSHKCLVRHVVHVAPQEVLFLSDAQMQDFAFLRRLYLTKRAVLAFERKKLVEQLHINSSTLPHPAEGELNASDLAGKLRQNAREDYEVYIKIGYAVRRGVSLVHITAGVQNQSLVRLPLRSIRSTSMAPTNVIAFKPHLCGLPL